MKAGQFILTTLTVLVSLVLINTATYAADLWINASDMLHDRQLHTATLLQNGKVLIAGWYTQEAELYNPETGAFTEIGSTIYYHWQGFTATLLNDGKVLIAGGIGAQQFAELYNPETGSFEATAGLITVHSFHTATSLTDGRVLIAGGQDQNGPQTHAVCEIYDPQLNTFSLTDSLNMDRSIHTATLLPNGQVLIAGGIQTITPGNGHYLDSCELYNPVNGTFSLTQNLKQPRAGHQATLLNNSKVLISCGAWNQRYGELYDYASQTWSLTGDMIIMRRSYHTATLLNSGKVLLAGGYINSSTASAELYDPATNTFSAVDSMFTARMEHTATRLLDGSVLIAGGSGTNGAINLAELFIPDTTTVVGINKDMNSKGLPRSFFLLQNYPNPFNPTTTIQFQIPASGHVELYICTMNGAKVRTLINQFCNAGTHSITWDGRDDNSKQIASGMYVFVINSNGIKASKKMVLLK